MMQMTNDQQVVGSSGIPTGVENGRSLLEKGDVSKVQQTRSPGGHLPTSYTSNFLRPPLSIPGMLGATVVFMNKGKYGGHMNTLMLSDISTRVILCHVNKEMMYLNTQESSGHKKMKQMFLLN